MPIPPRPNIQHQLTHLASRAREIEQHSPRPARIRFFVPTYGVGTIMMTGRKAIKFGAMILDEPSVTWGVRTLQTVKSDDLPLCTATVTKWLTNDAGMYVGAEMGFRVDTTDTTVKLKWSVVFEGSTLRSTVSDGESKTTTYIVPADAASKTTF